MPIDKNVLHILEAPRLVNRILFIDLLVSVMVSQNVPLRPGLFTVEWETVETGRRQSLHFVAWRTI